MYKRFCFAVVILVYIVSVSACGPLSATSPGNPSPPTETPEAVINPVTTDSAPETDAPTPADAGAQEKNEAAFPDFSTVDLEGETFDDTIFAEQDLTVINFWGTYCGPCINEMPDLGELAQSMPEGSRLIGVVIDGSEDDLARQIVSETGANFPHLLMDNGLISYASTLVGVPTTVFVDSEGNIVGEPLVGSRGGEEYRAEIEAALATLR